VQSRTFILRLTITWMRTNRSSFQWPLWELSTELLLLGLLLGSQRQASNQNQLKLRSLKRIIIKSCRNVYLMTLIWLLSILSWLGYLILSGKVLLNFYS